MPKQKFIIEVPKVACITITGPTQCGKSIAIDRIKKTLEQEFGATVISRDWEEEQLFGGGYDQELADWEHKMVQDTIWVISEPLPPQPPTVEAPGDE